MDIKLIALDLDETLLLPDKSISEENCRVLNYAGEQGVYVTIASGRPIVSVRKILEKLPCIRYVVLSNGGIVMDSRNGEIIAEHVIPGELALKFYDFVTGRGYLVDYFCDGKRYVPKGWDDHVMKMEVNDATKMLMRSNCIEKEDARAFLAETGYSEKISVRFKNEAEKLGFFDELVAAFPDMELASSLPNNIEGTLHGVNKSSGLADLAAYLGFGIENVMAFGDNQNDISMIKAAGMGVAMGNATEEVKKIADAVTLDNVHDGVAYMVREVFGWQQELL